MCCVIAIPIPTRGSMIILEAEDVTLDIKWTSEPFGGRPEKQADAHLFTFVLDELKGKNKKKSQEAAKPAKSAPKKKKNAEKEAEDAPFWSNIFADEGKSSLNKIAAKSHLCWSKSLFFDFEHSQFL